MEIIVQKHMLQATVLPAAPSKGGEEPKCTGTGLEAPQRAPLEIVKKSVPNKRAVPIFHIWLNKNVFKRVPEKCLASVCSAVPQKRLSEKCLARIFQRVSLHAPILSRSVVPISIVKLYNWITSSRF